AIKGRKTGNSILSKDDYNRLFSDAVLSDDDGDRYGYFWERNSSGLWGHTGGDPGVTTVMFVDESSDYGCIAFFNGYAPSGSFYRKVVETTLAAGKKLAKD
ncbi:MAG: hypothetical protein AAF597_17105, partial [Bacteroidota bacterium]